jgi:hypothetical protein
MHDGGMPKSESGACIFSLLPLSIFPGDFIFRIFVEACVAEEGTFSQEVESSFESWHPRKNIVVQTYWLLCFDLAPARSLCSISSSMQEDEFQIFNAD